VEHFLTMTTGLRSRDSYLYEWEGLGRMRRSEDWVQYVLGLPAEVEPGVRFDYSNCASFLLSAAISGATGLSALEYARRGLFGPLGITDVQWPSSPQGISLGWGELRMLPGDLARFGLLYLHDGVWNGSRLVSRRWVRTSTSPHVEANTLQTHYGYHWWVSKSGEFLALGYAGQYLIVSRDQDLVVVFTSSLADADFFLPWRLFGSFVRPAVHAEKGLPANREARERLESAVRLLAEPAAQGAPVPAMAAAVSGVRYDVEDNPFALDGLSLAFSPGSAKLHEHYADRRLDYRVGMDGRFEFSDVPGQGLVGVRGTWVGDDVFRIEFEGVGSAWWTILDLSFDDAGLTVRGRYRGGSTSFRGSQNASSSNEG